MNAKLLAGVSVLALTRCLCKQTTRIFGANTRNRGIRTKIRNEGELAWIRFVFNLNLLPGESFLSLGIAQDDDTVDNRAIDRRYDLAHFTVQGALNDLGFAALNMKIAE